MPSTPTEAKTLKPCPYCGGTDIREGYIRDGRIIYCGSCSATVRAFQPNASIAAATLWNRRADSSLLSLIDEMAKALEAFSECCPEFEDQPDDLHVFLEWNDEGEPAQSLPVADFRRARSALSRYTEFLEQNNG